MIYKAPATTRFAVQMNLLAAVVIFGAIGTSQALALSEIRREELPAPTTSQSPGADGSENAVPMPDDSEPDTPDEPAIQQPAQPDSEAPAQPGPARGQMDPAAPIPEVLYDTAKLPVQVQQTREKLLEICRSGDIEGLRPLLGTGEDMTQLSLAGLETDPIEHLKSVAGDEDGQEILAILEEVLSAGYVHLDPGTPEELYAWPYFFAVPIDRLTGPQRVELFKIVTAGDYEEMKEYGSYIFYRVGITPEGRWAFFVAGE
ncbi:hypothetical protein KEU06_18785 [Pseudaminobacter sp. 19-2017]|uniref:Fibronectin attachment protein n=1 Tax=Pseudaminobacter soli (ex Zhang et al. 2022) TaxID=2831468 RepID=A0A942E0L3_9HYPH|nr:hypothetical protein [Pseudaminobacter soli]